MSLWDDWLGETPSAQYFASLQSAEMGPWARRYFSNMYDPIYNQYMGAMGRQVKKGQEPTQTFQNFLDQFKWTKQLQQLSPYQKGQRPSAMAPRSRWQLW